jgi:hypothetical protein
VLVVAGVALVRIDELRGPARSGGPSAVSGAPVGSSRPT